MSSTQKTDRPLSRKLSAALAGGILAIGLGVVPAAGASGAPAADSAPVPLTVTDWQLVGRVGPEGQTIPLSQVDTPLPRNSVQGLKCEAMVDKPNVKIEKGDQHITTVGSTRCNWPARVLRVDAILSTNQWGKWQVISADSTTVRNGPKAAVRTERWCKTVDPKQYRAAGVYNVETADGWVFEGRTNSPVTKLHCTLDWDRMPQSSPEII